MPSWSPTLPAISAEDFSQTSGTGSVVVLLWAVWDPTSRNLDARLAQAADDYPNLHFYAMDLEQEQNWPLAREWGIVSTPSLVCLFKGVFQELLYGSKPEPQLRAKLEDWNRLADLSLLQDTMP